MDKLPDMCVPQINFDMPPLTKRRRKGNDKPSSKDCMASENERSDDAIEHAPISVAVQPPAMKQRKDKKSRGFEIKQPTFSREHQTDRDYVNQENPDVSQLIHTASDSQLIKMEKITSVW